MSTQPHVPADLLAVASARGSAIRPPDFYQQVFQQPTGGQSLLAQYAAKRLLVPYTGAEVTRLMDIQDEARRPDAHAHVRAHRMLLQLTDLGFNVPADDVYSDPDKAIRILWHRADRTVELVFPSCETEPDYLYRSDERSYNVEENPGADVVKRRLLPLFMERPDIRAA